MGVAVCVAVGVRVGIEVPVVVGDGTGVEDDVGRDVDVSIGNVTAIVDVGWIAPDVDVEFVGF